MTEQAPSSLVASTRLCAVVFVADYSFCLALPSSGRLVIGRSADAPIHLPSARVSRAHAILEITSNGEAAILEDLGSRNGTLVNGCAFEGRRTIAHGDELTAGDVRVMFLRRSSLPVESIAFMPVGVFLDALGGDVAKASTSGSPLWLFSLQLPQPWHEASLLRRELEAMPRVGYYGVLADNVIGIAAPQTQEDEALAIEELLVAAMQRARLAPVVGMTSLRRGQSASGLADEALDAVRIPQKAVAREGHDADIVARSPAMVQLLEQARQLAQSPLHLLLAGETGAGKEVLAHYIHQASGRQGPLVAVNAAALPENLLESELFGHERGAFSGAAQAKVGLIEAAHKGTLFLDEIGELPLSMQAKLLRVLEDCCVRRIGATTDRQVDVRFISATNRDLEGAVRAREFRQDLLFRLNAGVLRIPPLRERRGEIGELAQFFLARAATIRGMPVPKIAPTTLAVLEQYDWPGNVRELRNVMDRALALAGGASVAPKHLPEGLGASAAGPPSVMAPSVAMAEATQPPPPSRAPSEGARAIRDDVAGFERERIERALRETNDNQTKAAALLGIPRRTLAYRMARLGIRPRG